jgi:hypothetical protein
MAHISGFDTGEIIDQAHAQTGPHEPKRAKAQRESLIRNRVILERLGCIDEAGMIKLIKGNSLRGRMCRASAYGPERVSPSGKS